jgi:hypothetical protein
MWVHVDSEPTRWRIEMAIPFSELGPQAPRRQDAWAVSVTRTVPGVEWQAWPSLSRSQGPDAEAGLIQFR